jgi:hypothetical protein
LKTSAISACVKPSLPSLKTCSASIGLSGRPTVKAPVFPLAESGSILAEKSPAWSPAQRINFGISVAPVTRKLGCLFSCELTNSL